MRVLPFLGDAERFNREDDTSGLLRFFQQERHMLQGMMRQYVMEQKVPVWYQTHQVYSRPDGWWQTFKDQYFRGWIRKAFPIRYTTDKFVVTHNFYFACPHLEELEKVRKEAGESWE